MSFAARFLTLSCLLFGLSAILFAQKNDPEARAAVAGGAPQFAAWMSQPAPLSAILDPDKARCKVIPQPPLIWCRSPLSLDRLLPKAVLARAAYSHLR